MTELVPMRIFWLHVADLSLGWIKNLEMLELRYEKEANIHENS